MQQQLATGQGSKFFPQRQDGPSDMEQVSEAIVLNRNILAHQQLQYFSTLPPSPFPMQHLAPVGGTPWEQAGFSAVAAAPPVQVPSQPPRVPPPQYGQCPGSSAAPHEFTTGLVVVYGDIFRRSSSSATSSTKPTR